jgi:hypothetical protein
VELIIKSPPTRYLQGPNLHFHFHEQFSLQLIYDTLASRISGKSENRVQKSKKIIINCNSNEILPNGWHLH